MAALDASPLKGSGMELSILWPGVAAIVSVAGGGAGGGFLPGSGGGWTVGGLFLDGKGFLWGAGTRATGGVLDALKMIDKTDLESTLVYIMKLGSL